MINKEPMFDKGNSAVIVIITILVVGLVAWYYLTGKPGGEFDTLSTEAAKELDLVSKKFLENLKMLDNISIDTSLFKDPVFAQLIDFSREIQPEPEGRANPFAPIDENALIDIEQDASSTQSLDSVLQGL